MKKQISKLTLALFLFTLLLIPGKPSFAVAPFSDMGTYSTPINYLYDQGIVKGNDDGTVTPERFLIRAEAVVLILRARNQDRQTYSGTAFFPDVPLGQWYSDPIYIAEQLGYVDGNDDGTFAPARTLNKVEIEKIFFDAYGFDIPNISGPWYAPYEALANQYGILSNYKNPGDFVSRGDVFDFLYRLELDANGTQPLEENQPKIPSSPTEPTNPISPTSPTNPDPIDIPAPGEDPNTAGTTEPSAHTGGNSTPVNAAMIFGGSSVAVANNCTGCHWSDPTSWAAGTVPLSGHVHIPIGTDMNVDQSASGLGTILIEGALRFNDQDLNLEAGAIFVTGLLEVGTKNDPFSSKAVITLTDTDTNGDIMGMGTRGIMVMNQGILNLQAETPQVIWTQLNAHANAGDTTLTLKESVDWKPGDEIVIAPTDFYGMSNTEQKTISSVSGNQITLTSPMNEFHWGLMQYVTNEGVGYQPDPSLTLPHPDTPTEIDERAEVGLLSRNIVIQSADDSLFQNQGFGAHVMVMGGGTSAYVHGVELNRVGQAGRDGRYPFHFHHKSYSGTSQIGDTDSYFNASTVRNAQNRAMVIHGTNGAQVDHNVIYNVRGHAVFIEDAVEERNSITYNLVLRVRDPEMGNMIRMHEVEGQQHFSGSSAYWITNPNNYIRGNVGADTNGPGFWLAFPASPIGDFQGVDIKPQRTPLHVFDDNTAHTTKMQAFHLDDAPTLDGGVVSISYAPSPNPNANWGKDNFTPTFFNNLTAYKAGSISVPGGYWHRGVNLRFVKAKCFDCTGIYMNGSGSDGKLIQNLLIGRSNNNANLGTSLSSLVNGIDTYHGTFESRDNLLVNFDQPNSSAFSAKSAYIRPVTTFTQRNTTNKMINSHFMTRPVAEFPWFTLAGAVLDFEGLAGPAGNFLIYDVPFLTHNANTQPIEPAGNGVSSDQNYFGIYEFQLNQGGVRNEPYDDLMAIRSERRDDNNFNALVDVWEVQGATPGALLAHMRDIPVAHSGIYTLDFPGSADLSDITFSLERLFTENDFFTLGLKYNGDANFNLCLYVPTGLSAPCHPDTITFINSPEGSGYANAVQHFSSVGSIQEVINNNGFVYYYDAADQRVWIKFRGKASMPVVGDGDFDNIPEQYKKMFFRIQSN